MTSPERIGRIKAQIEETVEELEDLADDLDDLDDEDEDEDQDDESDDEDDEDEDDDEEPAPGGPHPSDVLPVLKDWTIMLPTGSDGDPDNLYLVGKSIPDTYFVRDGAVVFRCYPATAVHSKNSKYGRAEGRQMVPGEPWEKSAWPSGTPKKPAEPQHLHARIAIDASRLAHPIVNGAQIHDGGDDVMQVQSRDGVLGIAHDDGDSWEVIDPDYGTDGAVFDLDIRTTGRGEIVVDYDGAEAVRIEKSGSGWYWKAGCYPNTGGANTERREDEDAYAEVVFYELDVEPL